jgi:drug/metabolite transporter (DMT)-like permease
MRSSRGRLYLTAAFSLAGTSVVTGRFLSQTLSGFTITAVSMGVVLAGLLPFYARNTMKTVRRLSRRDWLMLLFQAAFGIFLFRMFLLLGVRLTSAAEAGILTGTTPAITAAMAYFLLREKISGPAALGVCGTAAGILLLQGNSLLFVRFSGRHLLGNVLILCAAASEAAFNVISRKHQAGKQAHSSLPIHPMVQTLLVSAIALGLSLIPAFFERPFEALPVLGAREWLALLWYGLVVTALAFACFYAGAKRCDAYAIAAFSGAMPLTAILLSQLLFHETITVIQWVGGGMILFGMTWIGQKDRRTPCSQSTTP